MHQTVLLHEAVKLLEIKSDGIYVDATGGRGGHSQEILKSLGDRGRLVVSDCDDEAIAYLQKKFSADKRVTVIKNSFSGLFEKLNEMEIKSIDGLLADLGVSSPQIDTPERGFSFMSDGVLDMRMDQAQAETAAGIIANFSKDELADLFFNLGEERLSRKIASAIVYDRDTKPFLKTSDLSGLCERVLGRFYKNQKIHPATRVFQALRMVVNHEMEELKSLLEHLPMILNSEGVAAIISFHSLEDRMVKNTFKELKQTGWNLLTKKPILSSIEEIKNNPRSRSAKLRGIKRS